MNSLVIFLLYMYCLLQNSFAKFISNSLRCKASSDLSHELSFLFIFTYWVLSLLELIHLLSAAILMTVPARYYGIHWKCFVLFRIFERIRMYFSQQSETIPMSFVLGFYVSLVVKRWWEQYKLLPWPDTLALFLNAGIPGAVSTYSFFHFYLFVWSIFYNIHGCATLNIWAK